MIRRRGTTSMVCALLSFVACALAQAPAKEIAPAPRNVPGSAADPLLQADIRAALEQLEVEARPDCKLQVQAAESCPIGQSGLYARMSQEAKESLERALRQDLLHVETWHAASCGEAVDYEVLLLRSPQGGTDIMAERLETAQPARAAAENGAPVADPPAADPAMPAGFETYQGLKAQFTIEIPHGWHVVDQNATMGRPGPYGVVLFSAVETGAGKSLDPEEEETIIANMRKVGTGEIPSFIVERIPNQKGRTCAGYDKKALKKVVQIMTSSSAMGPGSKLVGEPSSEVVPVGGCTGVKVNAHFQSAEGEPESILVYSVTDGQTDFDIALRGEDAFFEANRAVFERAVASLRLASAK